MTFNEKLQSLLKTDPRFVDQDGDLLKSEVIDKAWKIDRRLIELLLDDTQIKAKFFDEIKGHWVFNINTFIDYVQDKNFYASSYTKFRNKIGLTIDGKYLKERGEVALVWPYKDCVLEGGQTKEEEKRKEIFFNEVLAQDEIDRLLDPKVLTHFKRYTVNGEEPVTEFKRDKDGTIRENLIIKGNNLLALHSLKKQFQGKVKLIYIDPPYNTGNDTFCYNDGFNNSTWMTFMRNRIEIARELLKRDGSLFVQLDYNQSHYCKILLDEIFGKECFRNEIIWQRTTNTGSSKGMSKKLSNDTDSILYYSKTDSPLFNRVYKEYSEEYLKRFKYKDKYGYYRWQYMATYSKEKYNQLEKEGKVRWLEGSDKPEYKQYLKELKGIPLNNLWTDIFHVNPMAKEGTGFKTQKPEDLLNRIISISTNEGDIVLDFFSGSGTSASVAHKMRRQWIAVEQMDYMDNIIFERLKKVIGKKVKKEGRLLEELDYDRSGISKSVKWTGGGDFIYCELMKYNEAFIERIGDAKDTKALLW